MNKKNKHKDPRYEKLMDFRHHRSTKYWYDHECKYVRKLSNRIFRRKFSKNIFDENFYKPVPHDYKTYGWITW